MCGLSIAGGKDGLPLAIVVGHALINAVPDVFTMLLGQGQSILRDLPSHGDDVAHLPGVNGIAVDCRCVARGRLIFRVETGQEFLPGVGLVSLSLLPGSFGFVDAAPGYVEK